MYTLNSPSQYGGFLFRQLSRSPHSKRSQRRHSPYSSLDSSRFVAIKFFWDYALCFSDKLPSYKIKLNRWICQASYLLITWCLVYLLLSFYVGEGGQDPDHLFGGRDERWKQKRLSLRRRGSFTERSIRRGRAKLVISGLWTAKGILIQK